MDRTGIRRAALAALAAFGLATQAGAQTEQDQKIAELERKVEALGREVEKQKFSDVVGEPGESKYGMGASASKIYFKEQGVSLGGYGEMLYQNFESDEKTDEIDFLRWILYTGYRYNEKFLFNSEIEIEHAADDKEGEVAVEFAYIDYLHGEALNARAGMVLVPVGLVNEIHEPNAFLGARRPDVENRIIPTTWRENGAGLFGDLGPFSYQTYILNGMEAEGFSAAGLRGGRQKGSKASAEDLAWVGRLDYTATPGLLAGGSVYYGDSGQDLDVEVSTTLVEGHVDWKRGGWDLRALVVAAQLDNVEDLNAALAEDTETPIEDFASVGEELFGWYIQAGFDILSLLSPGEAALIPFVRYEQYNTQDAVPSGFKASGANDVEVITTGVSYKPITEVVIKADYQFYDNEAGTASDQWNLALGYVF